MSEDDSRHGGDKGRPQRRRRRRTQGGSGSRSPSGAGRTQRADSGAAGERERHGESGATAGRERRGRRRRRPTSTAADSRRRAPRDEPGDASAEKSARRSKRRGRRPRGERTEQTETAPRPTVPPRPEADPAPRDPEPAAEPAPPPRSHHGPPYDFELPDNPPADDPDPVTAVLDGADRADERSPALSAELCDAVGVKFAPAGKIYVFDSGAERYERGEQTVVESDRGPRIGAVAIATHRRPGRPPERRALRRPSDSDHRALSRGAERAAEALEYARDRARELGLPIKVYRIEPALSGNKLVVYFSSEQRIDFRELVRDLARQAQTKVEMRQTGVRDEAKTVGGIGSCGQELCCTTWLPAFVPVSIKMAKDQGMVLNPAKVAGQCGRLKCCLVYEQSTYAEMRKGLPKVGKRVITGDGEGRVVEVDVLHQRVRVSLEGGRFQTYPAGDVQAKFPSQQPASRKGKGAP